MDKYIQKLNFDFLTNQRVMQLIAAIDEYRGKWNMIEKRENRYLKELRIIAIIESIGSSTRIEGATMTDEEIQKLLKDVKITKFNTRDEQEVIGYYEVLELIIDNFSEIRLSENYIKQLHQLLLKHSNKDERHRGNYKNLPNKVVATYPTGEQKTIFAPTEPALVESEMFELLEWTNLHWKEKTIHPLIVLAVFVYEFLSIHPFRDGNGRLSRLLTTLFLLRQGFIIEQKTVKAADLSAAFPEISLNTLKKDLQYLKAEQIITAIGQGKGTVYVINLNNENNDK